MATPTADILRQTIAAQAATAPRASDAYPWLTRYIFVPFGDRRLNTFRRAQYNLPHGLKQGMIHRIAKFDRPMQIDDDAVSRVPVDRWGNYVRTSYGTSDTKTYSARPMDVVSAILRSHNPEYVTGGEVSNGIVEVVSMRGIDDAETYIRVQAALLPEVLPTAREQLVQLERADVSRCEPVYETVRQELMDSTNTAVLWGRGKYGELQLSVEEYGRTGRTGKAKLSRFDRALCRWLEVPEPRLQTMLQGQGTVQSTGQTLPNYVVCEDCGNMINLLPDGRLPRRGCIACGWNPAAAGDAEVVVSPPQSFDPANPMGEPQTFEKMQAELNAKRIK